MLFILIIGVQLVAEMLGHPLTDVEIATCMSSTATGGNGFLNLEELTTWWNSSSLNPYLTNMLRHKTATHESIEGTGAMFG